MIERDRLVAGGSGVLGQVAAALAHQLLDALLGPVEDMVTATRQGDSVLVDRQRILEAELAGLELFDDVAELLEDVIDPELVYCAVLRCRRLG